MIIRTGIITGTGFYTLPGVEALETLDVETPYGTVAVRTAQLGETPIAFIPRHGEGHTIAPRDINFRANIHALHALGVEHILSTSVSGSLARAWPPGTLVLVEQFLDFTSGRRDSFYPMDGRIAHIDCTDPYCPTLSAALLAEADAQGLRLETGGVYACTNGPRLETAAEVERLRRAGANLVGHTNYPEAVLARERAICYATLAVVSNYAAGMQAAPLTTTEIVEHTRDLGERIAALFAAVIDRLPTVRDDRCARALDEAFL